MQGPNDDHIRSMTFSGYHGAEIYEENGLENISDENDEWDNIFPYTQPLSQLLHHRLRYTTTKQRRSGWPNHGLDSAKICRNRRGASSGTLCARAYANAQGDHKNGLCACDMEASQQIL